MGMAYNANNDPLYRTRIRVSIHGPRVGLDDDNMLVGPPDLKRGLVAIQSTVPNTAVAAHGITRVLTSGSSQGPVQHQLDAPMVGIRKTIVLNSTSTGSQQFGTTAAGASVITGSDGTTAGWINMRGPGGAIELLGLTTDKWAVVAQVLPPCTGSTGQAATQNILFTTSTA